VIFNNREMAALARRRPTTLTALQEVDGIGRAKAQRYGPDLLKVLAVRPGAKGASRE
jgi:ATP-dependent DNA helicase RecQ